MTEMISLPCNCTSDKHGNKAGVSHQESLLGKGNRFHNKGGSKNSDTYRCTVCGNKVTKDSARASRKPAAAAA